MKLNTIVMSLAVVGMLFTSCDDSKKKEEAAKAEAAKMEMEAAAQAEAEMAEAAAKAKAEFDANTIVAIAAGNENFSTLVSAVTAAGLVETLQGEGPFTVFAPTNEAFAKVPKATLANLMAPESKAALTNLLTYHVVAGEYKAADVVKAINDNNGKYNVTTVQGENIVLSLQGDKVMITDAKGGKATVVMADVDASNGVIHAIDKVVMPKK
jgi:uncharacterized surface protein with fasciclin (FAS1) repeats